MPSLFPNFVRRPLVPLPKLLPPLTAPLRPLPLVALPPPQVTVGFAGPFGLFIGLLLGASIFASTLNVITDLENRN
ncbi:hypothetical protein ACJMK2_022076, partial [Sinanodonta woodiana]